MNKKLLRQIFLCGVAVLFAAVAASYASPIAAFMGTWQLNTAKSKLAAGGGRNTTVAYTMSDGKVTCTIDGTDASGQTLHSVWTGQLDGKDYPVTGDPASDARSYRVVSSHIIVATEKKDGKVVDHARIVVSADGKTRTVTVRGRNANGKRTVSVAVYDKQ